MLMTPCQAGYNCPYCRQVDTFHTVSMVPQCPIRWIDEETVYDSYTGYVMPFVKRPESKQRKDDDSPYLLPILENHAGKKRQVRLYRV